MSAHTPGPWRIDGKRIRSAEIDESFPKGKTVAQVDKGPVSDSEYYANLALIAAAPELLTALTLLDRAINSSALNQEEYLHNIGHAQFFARNAIAKAERR